MYNGKKVTLISFATLDLKRSIKRFSSQAINSEYYDQIKIITPNKFSDNIKKKINFFLNQKKTRGYCYWYWKPLLVLETLEAANEDEIVHYLDIGFHIKKSSHNRFYEYLDLINEPDRFILAFQYFPLNNKVYPKIDFPKREEYKFSKSDLLAFYSRLNDKSITHTPQFSAGNIFFKKNEQTKSFLLEWLDVFEKRFDLVDDTPSKINNSNKFIENRHDQSVFSILCKINHIKPLSAYEYDWCEKENKRTWEHNEGYPFLAKRDLKYNIFKRFIKRQVKTFNRFKNFLIRLKLERWPSG